MLTSREASKGSVLRGFGTIPTFGDESNIVAAATETNSFAVAVTASDYLDGRALSELSWELEGLNIEMFIAPGVIDVAGPRLQLRPVAGLSVIHVEKPKYHGAKQFEKRLFDAVFSSLVLFVGLPILIGIAIKLTSPGNRLLPAGAHRSGRPALRDDQIPHHGRWRRRHARRARFAQ